MGGIGKTALSVKLAEQLMGVSRWGQSELPAITNSDPFQQLCWKSLRDAPALSELLAELLESLAPATPMPDSLRGRMSTLLTVLQQQRCLIVLDNFDALLEAGTSGQYRAGCEDYAELLRRLGEIPHRSCAVITSRERPQELTALAGSAFAVQVMQLQGLSPRGAGELLQVKGLTGSAEATEALVQRYSGNPLALKIAATSIQEMFKGDLNRFLRQRQLAFSGITQLLGQQFSRLSPLELQVMYWLAINRESVSLEELQSDLVPAVDQVTLLEAVESLSYRSLIEQTAEGFTQQPVVMEYVTANFIDQISAEIGSYKPETIQSNSKKLLSLNTKEDTSKNVRKDIQNTAIHGIQTKLEPDHSFLWHYALIKATAKDYIRESQTRMILEPIIQRLRTQLGKALLPRLEQIAEQGRRQSWQGYLIGNLINLLRYLEADLTRVDFSNCQIWQAIPV
jgi:hypothetical protein